MKKNKKKIVIGIICLTIVVSMIFMANNNSEEQSATTTLQTETVKRGDINNSTIVTGEIISSEETTVVSRVTGEVRKIDVSKGDYVEQGDLLLSIDTKELDSRIKKAEIALKKKEAELSGQKTMNINKINTKTELKNKYDFKAKELESNEILYNNGAISLHELEQSRIDAQEAYNAYAQVLNVDNSSLTVAELEYKELKIEYNNLLMEKEYYEIVSPIEGIVIDVYIIEGEVTGKQQQLIHIVNTNNLKVTGYINEFEADNIALGNVFEISKYGETYSGEITYISPVIKTLKVPGRGDTKVIEIEGILYDENLLLLAGSDVTLDLILQKSEDALIVSQKSIFNNEYVIKIEGEDYILVEVITGVQDLMNIEVVSGELNEGDIILSSPTMELVKELKGEK
ncbi:HlyD family efflux transporter periplasmic adaptor subunit [Alkaliphilus pronyensis]|uniref:HlyD family efflux transporter periplasmic adaptor subunit n=1 Tax=Alkaliphilus pronyensis TaxID=1482732 RepID=A0A6I0FJU0_9FIRM|nr:HlyD family efflux transporter periplasmic adaptor subunit [Alkaliphilus pronyensis]KAB3539029.1 HlyD family efflux transporter periplasmic adaptor subunit [Alkaliphilus pronyensis]